MTGEADRSARLLAWAALAGVPASIATRFVPGGPDDPLTRALFAGFLVIVPLALACAAPREGRGLGLYRTIALLAPVAGACATASFFLPTRTLGAALLAGPWMALGVLALAYGRLRLAGRTREPAAWGEAGALMVLPLGAAFFAVARLGIEPLGLDAVTVTLAAIHFHFATLAAPMITSLAIRAHGPGAAPRIVRTARWATALVLVAPAVVAAGVIASRPVQLAGTVLFTLGLAGTAALCASALRHVPGRVPRLLVAVAIASVAISMPVACAYGVGLVTGAPPLDLEWMTRIHGYANAHGFSTCGLAGFYLALAGGPATGVSTRA